MKSSKKRTEERVLVLSGKEAVVLELLLGKPAGAMYGLELVKSSQDRLKRGTIYVTLDRMENKGFIESRVEQGESGGMVISRPLYRPTGYGQKVYEAWQLAREAVRLRPVEVGGVL